MLSTYICVPNTNLIVMFPIIYRFIYVPSPHTHDVIGDELYEPLVDWNLDEKVSTITLDNCTTNDRAIPYLVWKIGRSKLAFG